MLPLELPIMPMHTTSYVIFWVFTAMNKKNSYQLRYDSVYFDISYQTLYYHIPNASIPQISLSLSRLWCSALWHHLQHTLNTKAASSSETLVTTQKTTWCHDQKTKKVIFCVIKAPNINHPLLLPIAHPHVIMLILEDEVAGSSKMAVALFLQHTKTLQIKIDL